MRFLSFLFTLLIFSAVLYAQQPASTLPSDNIYTIKQQFLYNELHNPNDQDSEDDNDLARFNRWFNLMEPRCYPSGNLPKPSALLTATKDYMNSASARKASGQKTTAGTPAWSSLGPTNVPSNHNGIGRVNCIVLSPQDTNTLYIGTACGGVHISHDGGTTWTTNSDNFPSLSIADIAVNPIHPDTLYAATGDGYGYETGGFSIFWGGLYSAGVMKSTNGGISWQTTGLSFVQSDKDIIQKLLIHPTKTNILLAATRHGIMRSTDAGTTWTNVDPGNHVFSMAFRPQSPDTVYAINTADLRVSYNAGATWQTLRTGMNPTGNRCTIGVSPAAPGAIWILDANNKLKWSHNGGSTFVNTNPPDTANFYGYYDRVLAISPTDSNYILAFGMIMAISDNGGVAWVRLNPDRNVHVDNHAAAINPLHPATIYTGNDGGISVTRNGGASWKNLSNGLTISQIYRMSSSQQSPNIILCGLQDNGCFHNNGTNWLHKTGGDGEAVAIHPMNDLVQIASSQNGSFSMSLDRGATFNHITVTAETGSWTSPVTFDPFNDQVIYYGYKNIFVTRDQGGSYSQLTSFNPFSGGATNIAVGRSNTNVIYASDMASIIRSIDGGANWTNILGNLPTNFVAITDIAVDPRDAMKVYVTTSGYLPGYKLFYSSTGGNTWTNISSDLPNIPANTLVIDTTTTGAMFVGTDMGVFYTDSSQTGWTRYGTGLPNVLINDLELNYGNYKVRAATFGRGVWEAPLKAPQPNSVKQFTNGAAIGVDVVPNPSKDNWTIIFNNTAPTKYSVKVYDVAGRIVAQSENSDKINATKLPGGVYSIEVTVDDKVYHIKSVKD